MRRASYGGTSTVWLMIVVCVLFGGRVAEADFTFGRPLNLGPTVNFSAFQQNPYISRDGLSLYFSGGPITSSEDLWVTERDSVHDDWGKPTNLGFPVNTSLHEFFPSISPDGLELYFNDAASSWGYTPRSGGHGECDIWVSTRPTQDHPWTEPKNLGHVVNSSSIDGDAKISFDGLSLYFTSNRLGGFGGSDIWMTQRATEFAPWGEPANLGSIINSAADEECPSVSADGLALFFDSDRTGGYGLGDLYMTTRTAVSDPWGTPVNVGPMVNTVNYGEVRPCISADGLTLYFGEFPNPRPGGYGRRNIWQTSLLPTVDFTGDYRVDIQDLLVLIEHWGQSDPAYDMGPMPWGDGVVDAADLEVLMRYWGQDVYDPHLLAYWPLDESEGDLASDSAMDNDASIIGNTTWQPNSGQVGGAIQLDGTNSYLEAPHILNPADGVFSAFAWVRGGAPGQVILSQEGGANWLVLDAQGNLQTALKGGTRQKELNSGALLGNEAWNRVGLVWDGESRILYVDDVEVARDPHTVIDKSKGGMYIGAGSGLEAGTFWTGLIDDVRIYDRAVEP